MWIYSFIFISVTTKNCFNWCLESRLVGFIFSTTSESPLDRCLWMRNSVSKCDWNKFYSCRRSQFFLLVLLSTPSGDLRFHLDEMIHVMLTPSRHQISYCVNGHCFFFSFTFFSLTIEFYSEFFLKVHRILCNYESDQLLQLTLISLSPRLLNCCLTLIEGRIAI